jgi:predicted amidohydrolase
MRIGLIQEKQNRLYAEVPAKSSAEGIEKITFKEAKALQAEMLEQNYTLIETCGKNADLLVTAEAINFPGSPDGIDFNAWDLVKETYGEAVEKISEYTVRYGVWIAVCLYRPLDDGSLRNSVLVINRNGGIEMVYDKMHLAETEKINLTPGNDYCVFDAGFGKIGVCICWDMQFPEVCRILTLRGARIVICPTWGWEAIYARSRAYENGIYAAGAMAVPFNGPIRGLRTPSGVIDPEGTILASANAETSEVVCYDIDLGKEWGCHAIRMEDRRPELYRSLADKRYNAVLENEEKL